MELLVQLGVRVAVELAASAIIMKYWFPRGAGLYLGAGFLAIIVALNGFTRKRALVKLEFWCSLIKVVTVIAFIGIGMLMVFGIMHGDSHPGRTISARVMRHLSVVSQRY